MFTRLFQPLLARRDQVIQIANELAHWAFFKTYDDTLLFLEKRALTSVGLREEIRRTPLLLDHALWVLQEHIRLNVQPQRTGSIKEKLFAHTDLGETYRTYISWVDAGWYAVRTASNYEQRLLIWKYYFDHTYEMSHYHITMYRRMLYAQYTGTIPYGFLWNYGSHYMTGREGYPAHTGLHFLEYAQHRLEHNNQIALRQFEQYCVSLLETLGASPKIPDVLLHPEWEKYKEGASLYPLIGDVPE